VAFQKRGELLGRDRPAEVVALYFIAGLLAQEALLRLGLDTFGDNGESERPT
jgi:hypothetical protein